MQVCGANIQQFFFSMIFLLLYVHLFVYNVIFILEHIVVFKVFYHVDVDCHFHTYKTFELEPVLFFYSFILCAVILFSFYFYIFILYCNISLGFSTLCAIYLA